MAISEQERKRLGWLRRPRISSTAQVAGWLVNDLNGNIPENDPALVLARKINEFMPDQHAICKLINREQKKHSCLQFVRRAVFKNGVCTMEDRPRTGARTPEESKMILRWSWFHTLILRGEHYRVRPCAQCGRWFYQARRHMRFDSEACSRAWETSNPSYKQSRAEYMRRHRAEMKGE